MTDAPQLDDETRAALFLFNAHLAAEAEAEKAGRAVRRVEQQKDEAAARLRNLKQAGAPAAEITAAESDYRAAVERLQAVREGREPETAQTEPEPDQGETEPDQPEPEQAETEPDQPEGE
jgi:hypothetical protein